MYANRPVPATVPSVGLLEGPPGHAGESISCRGTDADRVCLVPIPG